MKPGSDPSRRSRFNLSIAMVLQGIIVAGLAIKPKGFVSPLQLTEASD